MIVRPVAVVLVAVALTGGCSPADTDDIRAAATATTSTLAAAPTTGARTIPPSPPPPTATSTTSATIAPTTTRAPTSTTSNDTTTTRTPRVEDLPSGLLCRDVAAAGFEYDRAVEYWFSEGRPDRMDADRNGIPCETVYPSVDVTSYWGDPLPTTLIAGGPFTVDEPTYFPSPMPGSGDAFGSGCSPGTRWLPDGIWFGHVPSATSTVITFDLMCFAPAPEYEEAIGRITNDSPTLRDVPADPGAIVYAIAPHGDGWTVVPYTSWYTDPGREGFCPPEGCWDVWVYVNNGKATEVVQLWFP